MSECSWWWSGLMFVAGIGVGQVFLMAMLMLFSGSNERDEHERGV